MGAGYRLCRYARPSPYWLKPIRALATLLPPKGGNTLRCRPISPCGAQYGLLHMLLRKRNTHVRIVCKYNEFAKTESS